MDIEADLDALVGGPLKCIERLVDRHGEDKRAIIEMAFDHAAPAYKVANLLTDKYGIHVSDKAILKHRRGDCGCR